MIFQPILTRPTFFEAIDIVAAHVRPLAAETIGISGAIGRCVAAPVKAARYCPPFDVSAMDGYAVEAHDVARACPEVPLALAIAAPAYAGERRRASRAGEAIPIATGAAVPAGVGAILIKEQARLAGERLLLAEALPSGMNIRRRGEDACAGETVLPAGRVVHAATIGALCAYGVASLTVHRRPRIALLPSGDELRSIADQSADAPILDANGPMIKALLEDAGAEVDLLTPVPDRRDAVMARLEALLATDADMIVTTGGVSAGERDHIPSVLRELGARVHFHGVRMRPGKPVLFATLPDGRPVFALPGNPVSALIGTRFFVGRALRAMAGRGEEPRLEAADAPPGKAGLTLVLKARRDIRADGRATATLLPGQQSHILRPLLDADCWLVTPDPGSSVIFSLYDRP
jgi:molybdopterin molybdotransferase